MNEKKLAKEILQDASKISLDISNLRKNAESFVKGVLKLVKDRAGSLPDEDSFLKLVGHLIMMSLVDKHIPQPYKGIIKLLSVPYQVLKLLDKYVLDKFLGEKWYDKMKSLVGST